jgi:hypothetical protein
MQKNASVDNILRDDPKSSKMIIDGMKEMPSADHSQNDPQKVFAYLHSVSQYVTNFFKNPNADPNTFGPPGPPNSVQLSKDDLNSFTVRAVNFVSDNWSNLQSQEVLQGNVKKDMQSQKGMETTKNKVLVNLEIIREVAQEQMRTGPLGMPGGMKISKEGLKEGAKGFLKGGKVGAVVGYITGASKEMAKRYHEIKQEKMDTRENLGETSRSSASLNTDNALKMR